MKLTKQNLQSSHLQAKFTIPLLSEVVRVVFLREFIYSVIY